MNFTIELDADQVNAITVQALKDYYKMLHEEVQLTQEFNILLSLDDVMSHFMTEREYEEFANGLCENTPRV
tara:strand:- start:428 stop:640 length:213 start_codon:yes stop_codon:yes gene_type:complete